MKIKLGFSTCPNDTFMFDALMQGRIDTEGFTFEVVMEDILHLNRRAMEGKADMIKLSYNAWFRVEDSYALLPAGSAMGQGCGPLLIAREPLSVDELLRKGARVAIPGQFTTANLLLNFFAPGLVQREEMLFHEVMPAVLDGRVEAGVIIHENRFTYQQMGLHCVQDLGAYWEEQTQLPIPLGAICARRSLGPDVLEKLGRVMQRSVAYALENPAASRAFVRDHAQEMSEDVMQAHIGLYVNDYSVNMGPEGEAAVARLREEGEKMGLYGRESAR